ncbi:MAG: DNA primase [Oscillospiraceae bacterium]|nr:DNA primase [Oscillospiraceae bacterium]
MPRFDESFLEELTARADIVDVVSRYVSLNRKGERYWGLCPFHGEKTPSFSVVPDKQFYYCFGCGRGGGVINFIMDAERLEFADAVAHLASLCNMELPERGDGGAADFKKRLCAMNAEAARFFHANLKSPAGAAAVAYLQKRRLSPATVTRFGLGYALPGWNTLSDHLRRLGYTNAEMLEGGLVRKSERGVYDVFRDRLMFPIIDARGNVLAFGGRVLTGDGNGQKYINTNNTPVYSKKNTLYAYNIARKTAEKQMILVEGYMDAVSLHQAGFTNTVASLGTALTAEHAKLLSRTVREVVIAYDTDKAGTAATERAIGIFSENGVSMKILRVPGGKDPDEFVRLNGAEEFRKVLAGAEQQMDYRLRTAKSGADLSTEEGRIAYLKAAGKLLSELSSRIELEVYAGRVAEETGVSRDTVMAEADRLRRAAFSRERKKEHTEDLNPERLVQPRRDSGVRYADPAAARGEEELISLLCTRPSLTAEAARRVTAGDFTSPELGRIYGALTAEAAAGKEPDVNLLSASLAPEDMRLLGKILAADRPHRGTERELADVCGRVARRRTEPDVDPLLALRDRKREQQTER